MRMVLTGASSFLGRALEQSLLEAGHEVLSLRHSFEEAEKALPASADVWLHFAWAGAGSAGRSDERVQAFNVDMSMAALQKAADLGCRRFVFAGSQAEYGPQAGVQRESADCRPVSAYGKAKAAFGAQAADFVRDWNRRQTQNACGAGLLQLVHLRIFSVYGPGDHRTALIPSCIRAFRDNRPMDFGPCSQDWNYLYIDDAAAAIQLLAEQPFLTGQPRSEEAPVFVCNVAGEDTRPLRSYIEELRSLCESSSPLHFGARANNVEGAADLRPDIGRLKRLGFCQRISFAEGIRRCLREEQQ